MLPEQPEPPAADLTERHQKFPGERAGLALVNTLAEDALNHRHADPFDDEIDVYRWMPAGIGKASDYRASVSGIICSPSGMNGRDR
jgi:hypothetical protein